MLGMIVCAELSRSTSAMPSSNVAMSTQEVQTGPRAGDRVELVGPGQRALLAEHGEAPRPASAPPRSTSIATIALRRSTRSVITPAGSVKTSHGRRWATSTSATSSGLRVTAEASHG